jgi:D-alanine-D-alanine ligase
MTFKTLEKKSPMSQDKTIDPKQFGKVAVLMGGWSAEREVSLNSGSKVLAALQRGGVDAHGVDVAHTILADLTAGQFDCAFNILHGPMGEDGVIQGALELLGLLYTGSGVAASALAMDKLRTKQLWQGIGLATPPCMVLTAEITPEAVVQQLGLPLAVKPACEGSTIGLTKVKQLREIKVAYEKAAHYHGAVLAEPWIEGSEYTVAIVNGRVLPSIRIQPTVEYYDYDAKYISNDTQYFCPSGLTIEEEKALADLASTAYHSLGCEGWGRVDFIRDTAGHFWILEVNTLPGMTEHSLVPMAAKAVGISFDALVLEILCGVTAKKRLYLPA